VRLMAKNRDIIPISVFSAGLSAGTTAGGIGATKAAAQQGLQAAMRHLGVRLTSAENNAEKVITEKLREFRDRLFEVVKNEERYFVRDHTLSELAKLGHPYATRRPAYTGLHDVDEAIHRQSEKLFDSMQAFDEPAGPLFAVKIGDDDSLLYWRYLKYGTSKMVPRDLGARIVADHLPEFKKSVSSAVKENVKFGDEV
jgi:hypothetical protein